MRESDDGHGSALFGFLRDVSLLILGLEMDLGIGLGCWRHLSVLYDIRPKTRSGWAVFLPFTKVSAAHISHRRRRASLPLVGIQLA